MRGFTYVEILVTLVIVAILFVPMMQLFSQAMEATTMSRDLITAVNLARWEMERVKNLSATLEQVRARGGAVWPPLDQPAFQLNGCGWRIERRLKAGAEPLEVTVEVRRDGEGQKSLASLTTLLSKTVWERKRPTAIP